MEASESKALFINFNQDHSLVAIGTAKGYMIYQCDPCQLMYAKPDISCGVVEMLFRSSLVALVGLGDKPSSTVRKVQIWNTKTDTQLQELNYELAVMAVKMNMKRLVVVLENQVHIHDLGSLKTLVVIQTEHNPKGLCALSPNNEHWEHCYLAYPNSSTEGEVTMYDAMGLQIQDIISAHQGLLANMSFNMEGSMLATCSETGTVIRIFDAIEGSMLFSFRRGSTSTTIYSLSFSLDAQFLCASSSHGTVHVFKLDQESKMEERNNSVGLLGGMMAAVTPDSLSTVMDPRSFAQVKLRESAIPNLCSMNATNSQVHVVTADAYFFEYSIPVDGGECTLVKESKLN